MNENELSALIQLLDDPDKEVYSHVHTQLHSIGPEIIPKLETAWEQSFDPLMHHRIENLIHEIQFNTLKGELVSWARNNSDNLLLGAYLISRYQYPDNNLQKMVSAIDKIKRQVWLEMHYDLTPLEQVNVFNHVMYSILGFQGNTSNIHDPQNAYLNCLLESKKGNPVSLGILYLAVAQLLDMPVYGVIVPQHFVLVYLKKHLTSDMEVDEKRKLMQFYINPFNKGMIFSKEDITLYLRKLNLDPKQEYFIPSGNVQIISYLIDSLIHSYETSGLKEKVRELAELKKAITGF